MFPAAFVRAGTSAEEISRRGGGEGNSFLLRMREKVISKTDTRRFQCAKLISTLRFGGKRVEAYPSLREKGGKSGIKER